MNPQLSPWAPLYDGIDRATGVCGTLPPNTQDNVNVLRVNLANPKIQLLPTPWELIDPKGKTVREFLDKAFDPDTMAAMVATNGTFGAESGYMYGPFMSEGRLISYYDANQDAPFGLLATQDNKLAAVGRYPDLLGVFAMASHLPCLWTALAGNVLLVENGGNVADPNDWLPVGGNNPMIAGRTAIGLSEPLTQNDPQYLYLLTIDGVEPGACKSVANPPDYGAKLTEAADWLIAAGAYAGINIDGGGSTTMARIDGANAAVLMNVPHNTECVNEPDSERAVINSFGVVVSLN